MNGYWTSKSQTICGTPIQSFLAIFNPNVWAIRCRFLHLKDILQLPFVSSLSIIFPLFHYWFRYWRLTNDIYGYFKTSQHNIQARWLSGQPKSVLKLAYMICQCHTIHIRFKSEASEYCPNFCNWAHLSYQLRRQSKF